MEQSACVCLTKRGCAFDLQYLFQDTSQNDNTAKRKETQVFHLHGRKTTEPQRGRLSSEETTHHQHQTQTQPQTAGTGTTDGAERAQAAAAIKGLRTVRDNKQHNEDHIRGQDGKRRTRDPILQICPSIQSFILYSNL